MSLSSDSLFYCLTLSMYVVSQGVRFSDNEMEETSFGDTVVIINCSTELKIKLIIILKLVFLKICISFSFTS
jgi:hypothetical protein